MERKNLEGRGHNVTMHGPAEKFNELIIKAVTRSPVTTRLARNNLLIKAFTVTTSQRMALELIN